jgi:hypothetical protein
VNPLLWNSATPVQEPYPGKNLIPDQYKNLIPVPVQEPTAPLVREELKEEKEERQSAQVTEQLPIRAASQEPPVEMSMSLGSSSSEAGAQLSNREGHVEVLSHTSKKEAPATVSLVGSPSIQGENPELISSPMPWAGRQQNQPAATKQTSPVPRPPSFDPFDVVMADFERFVPPPPPAEPIPAPAWLDEPSTEPPDEPTVECDDVFMRDVLVNPPGDYPDVPAIQPRIIKGT